MDAGRGRLADKQQFDTLAWRKTGAKRLFLACREPLRRWTEQTKRGGHMPKMKTHQGAAGRFEVRKKGRLKRWRAGHNHMLEKKSPE